MGDLLLTVRSRDAARTRAAILKAAQEAFATLGYMQAGVREIAAEAGADPALVRRYFGSKQKLFEAALAGALDIDAMLATPRNRFGAHVVAYFLNDDARERVNPLPIMMMAIADDAARATTLDLLQRQIIEPLGRWIGGPEGIARATRVSMLCSGFFTYWKILPLNALSDGVDSETRRWLEQALQTAIDL